MLQPHQQVRLHLVLLTRHLLLPMRHLQALLLVHRTLLRPHQMHRQALLLLQLVAFPSGQTPLMHRVQEALALEEVVLLPLQALPLLLLLLAQAAFRLEVPLLHPQHLLHLALVLVPCPPLVD
jgi:hypothetical protein